MESNGWTRTTVKVGDVITGTGYQFADGQKIIRLESVVLASGKEIRVYGRYRPRPWHLDHPVTGVERFLKQAVALAVDNVRARRGRPFGAVLVKDGEVLATGVNEVAATNDPTAHAEMQAIRAACRRTGAVRLDGCVMFASGHPCPMCLTAMYLTGVRHVYCAFSLEAGTLRSLDREHLLGARRSSGAALGAGRVLACSRRRASLFDVAGAAGR